MPVTRTPSDIAAVLIVRDEARSIARCLNSVSPWVDRIVVLDTGSTDDTVAIAQELGAEVHHLPWPESFAIARNHALTLADAEWNLVIDADEWIIGDGAAIREWCATAGDRLGAPCVHSEADTGTVQRTWMTRLLPRGVRYEGRVREQVASALPRHRIALDIGHDGDLAPQLARKMDRHWLLLLAELADRPDDAYLTYQLGKDAQMRGDLLSACDHYAQALAATPLDANWRHDLVINALHAFTKTGRLQEALTMNESEMANWPESPDYFFALGDLFLEAALAEPHRALDHWLPLAEGAWENCLTIGERPDLEGSVTGRGSFLAQYNLNIIRSGQATVAA
ncbi:glycosyltransferase family 2 protein [uncultured Sphingomonas sp.]|uniref:glycosyltransferase family 2 protein n=1 Tax=uncultured Sphingomonas sp. TaxID=158754 RepID=UPI0025E3F976|nr:glycosyltransferase family 2 protein [uncultured Sphingomonas sp.]